MGRVLAVLGYGTQFAEELELPEGKLVDTPVQFPSRANAGSSGAKTSTPAAPATNAREVAKQKAEAAKAAREAAANTAPPVSTPSTDDLPFDEQEVPATPAPSSAPAEATVEPINENQMKAIGNMVKMLVKKKGINEAEFIAGVCGRFGKATLAELSFEQGKEVVTQINAEMRAK
jgi:hypothetical protein